MIKDNQTFNALIVRKNQNKEFYFKLKIRVLKSFLTEMF